MNKPIRYAPCWVLCLFLSGMADRVCRAETKTIAVDCESSNGSIDMVLGTNRNPKRWLNSIGTVDMTAKLHDLGITALRTHGIDEEHSHPTNLEGIVPNWPNDWWSGGNDPFEDPASYNFDNAQYSTSLPGANTYVYDQSTDGKIDDIVQNGFTPLFRIGYRPNTDNKWSRFSYLGYSYMANPIPDTDAAREKMALVCENIVRHYNENWHNGRQYGIPFWEVWNEADLQGMWGYDLTNGEYSAAIANRTLSLQFQRMYAAIATRIRGTRSNPQRPEVKIGACALAWALYPTGYHLDKSQQFCEELMQYCRDHDVPLDFYSWHQYGGLQAQTGPSATTIWFGGNAWTYLQSARRISNALQTYGFPNTLSICDEWNSLCNQDNPYHDTNLAAAFTACVLMYLDYADVYLQNYWPMVNGWGLFDEYANYTREAYAYKAFSLLRADTPGRLAVTNGLVMDLNAATADNFAVLAGKSGDGTTIQFLLADEDQKWIKAPGATDWLSSSGGYWNSNAIIDPARRHYDAVSLTVDNLAPAREYTVTWRTIDANGTWVESAPESHSTTCQNRSIFLQKDWAPPAVCLVRISLVGPPPAPPVPGDFDCDGDVDQEDFGRFQACLSGPGIDPGRPECAKARMDKDTDVDQDDLAVFQRCMTGANQLGDAHCAD